MLGISIRDDDLVFCNLEGKPFLPDTVSHTWTKLAARLDIERISLHDARHTHASLMLKQGVHPKVVQERLGQASIQTTLDIYSHVVPVCRKQPLPASMSSSLKSPKTNLLKSSVSYPLVKIEKPQFAQLLGGLV